MFLFWSLLVFNSKDRKRRWSFSFSDYALILLQNLFKKGLSKIVTSDPV